ncbi:MAG: sensor histidine kinase, partial [Pedobacter sp.]
MNPYEKKRRWKFFLLIFAILIGIASVFYTDSFVKKMEREEANQFQLWVRVQERSMFLMDNDVLVGLIETVRQNTKMPVILTNKDGLIISATGLDSTKTMYPDNDKLVYDSLYFANQLKKMKMQHKPALMNIFGDEFKAYYRDSFILTQLRYFPYIQMGVIFLFLLTAYAAFSSARRDEQDHVWVGLA